MALGAFAGGYGIAWAVTSLSTTAVTTDSLTATNLKVRDSAINPTGNILEVANSGNSAKYLTVSSTSTQIAEGAVSVPSLTFIGDTDTGIYHPFNNTIAFSANSTETMRIDSAGVGIGATNIGTPLQVHGASSQTTFGAAPSSAQGISVMNTSGLGKPYGIQFGTFGGYTFGGLYGIGIVGANATSGDLAFALRAVSTDTTFTERMRIMAGGNVGVGTDAPQSTLHVPDGKYAQFEDNNAGAPPSGDCDSDAERGRMSIDTTNNRFYICNGASRGWDYVSLTD